MNRQLACALLLGVAAWTSGCATLDLDLSRFGGLPPKSANQVAEAICLWQPGEGIGLDGLPTRGFAGQVLFFVRGQSEPIRIDGDVRIYVFDDCGTVEEQGRPLHEFEFPAAVWDTFLQNTNLGPAYQIFIPYTRKGGNLANCALRMRMTAADRMPVYSKLATVTLPGRSATPEKAPESSQTPAAASAAAGPPESVAEMAAIQRVSAELGTGTRTAQLERLKSVARDTVQTADYNVEVAGEEEPATSAADDAEPAISSRRYRMSRQGEPE